MIWIEKQVSCIAFQVIRRALQAISWALQAIGKALQAIGWALQTIGWALQTIGKAQKYMFFDMKLMRKPQLNPWKTCFILWKEWSVAEMESKGESVE